MPKGKTKVATGPECPHCGSTAGWYERRCEFRLYHGPWGKPSATSRGKFLSNAYQTATVRCARCHQRVAKKGAVEGAVG